MSRPSLKNVLIARTDRIGDVLLSLPMAAHLHQTHPEARITFLVRTYTQELVEGQEGVADVVCCDTRNGLKGFRILCRELRERRFDAVVAAFPTFRLALTFLAAGIPVRVGTGYRWYSFLFNRRVYEHRKRGTKHEAEHNIALLTAIGCPAGKPVPPVFAPSKAARRRAGALLEESAVRSGDRLVVLHPGSGGSARDWRPERFGELARALAAADVRVVVTGSREERLLAERVAGVSEGAAVPLAGMLSLTELAALLERADLVVANSTGPLHLAAAVGTAVIGFYPPIHECSSRRWGPLTDRRVIFEPAAEECPLCRGGACRGDACMELITVEDVLRSAMKMVEQEHPVSIGERV